MTTPRKHLGAALLLGLAALLAGPAAADDTPTVETVVNMDRGTFGIMLAGGAGHMGDDTGGHGRYFVFADPPRVLRVVRGGPAYGKLEEDDSILAVDGVDVASEEGSRLLMRPDAGDDVVLRVLRDGEEVDVEITVGRFDRSLARDYTFEVVRPGRDGTPSLETIDLRQPDGLRADRARVERSSGRASSRSSSRAASRSSFVSRSRSGGVGTTRSWYGFGLETKAITVKEGDKDHSVIYFENPPRVYRVDSDGPAGRAGLRRGDVLVEIDGAALDEDTGALRFSSAEPGDVVSLVYERDGEEGIVELITEDYPVRVVRRPTPVTELAGGVIVQDNHLRYAGSMGDVDVEVRGVGEVSVSKNTGEIIIDTGSATVRLKLRDEREE
ncbi:MAG: PDZ domain-containing protein [bacterium]|nr:PDZ domain-containing protein [bacterium]